MKGLKRLFFSITVLLLSLLIIASLSLGIFAEDKDISRPGTTSKVKIDSVGILEELGIALSDAEKNYLTVYGESSVTYGSHIPSTNIKLDYDSEAKLLLVTADVYEYTSESGVTVSWLPCKVISGDTTLELSLGNDGRYSAAFDSFIESDDAELKVIYRTGVDLSENFINTLVNKTYSDAVSWDKYKSYLDAVDKYEADKIVYQNYLVSKRVYDENLAAYKVYLDELSKYNVAKAEYDVYLEAMKVYNAEHEKYLEYLEEKKEYEKNLELYNKYVENIAKAKKQLEIIDGTLLYSTSQNRSVYSAITGNLVDVVMENKDLIANEFVGANGNAVDNAGEATAILETMYKEYLSQKDEKAKYTYYAINYQNFKENFIKLFSALDKLYQNAKVRIAVDEQGYKVKFEIFLAQLYYTVNALSDTPVLNFDGDAYFNQSYVINRKTPLSLLEGTPYIVDTNAATPLTSGYPSPVEEPTITECREPQQPAYKAKPIEPAVVNNPGEEPTPVDKPVAPSFVSAPFGLANGESLPREAEMLVSEYRLGSLTERPLSSGAKTLYFDIPVSKKVFNSKEIVVSFCDENGNLIFNSVAEQGGYAEFVGNIPTKAETVAARYVFEGWMNSSGERVDITAIKSDTDITLYPYFAEYVKSYEVVWEIDDKLVVTECPYGEIPELDYVPSRPATEKYYYTFAGWNKEISPVVGDLQADRYFARFDKSYIVPIYDGDELLDGGIVVTDGQSRKIDCTAVGLLMQYDELRIDLSYLLDHAADCSAFTVLAPEYKADFAYSDAVRMKELGVDSFKLSSSVADGHISFTPVLTREGTSVGDVSVSLSLNKISIFDPENARIYKIENGAHTYVRGSISANSLSLTVPCGETYYVVNEYEAHLLATGPISLSIVGSSTVELGDSFEIDYSVPNGIRVNSVYMLDKNGVRTEITEKVIKMPVGGCSIGVDYHYIEYTVNFISSGNVIHTGVYRYGEMPEIPADPIRTADLAYTYTFDKWKNLSTGDFEIVPVTSNVSYEAMYIKTPIPPKEPTDELLISAPVLNKLASIAFFGGFILLVAIPCVIIAVVKIVLRVQRRAPRDSHKNKE